MPADAPPPFDTQRVAMELEASDFTQRQAGGLVRALVAATRHLATKADLIALKAELTAATDRSMDRQTISLIKWMVGLAVGFAALGLGMVGATITVLRWLAADGQ